MNFKEELRNLFEAKLGFAALRAEQTKVHRIIPNQYFSAASSEVRKMFIDGYFIGAITLSQAVAEGLSKFLCEKNDLNCPRKNHLERVNKLLRENRISHEAKDAFEQIHDGRKDFHHMNKDIETEYSKLEAKAKLSVDSLYLIEEEIFRFSWADGGKIVQGNPKYWDISSDGTSQVFLRCLL